MSGLVGGLDGEHVTGVHVVTDPLTAASVATFIPGLADRLDAADLVDMLQLAWVAGKFREWTDLPVDRDHVLTTVSLHWFTSSGASAAHTLYDQAHAAGWGPVPAGPQGFAVFGADPTVRRLVPAPDGAHWTEFPRGRHFPALEAPADLAADLQAFFGPRK